MKILLLILFIIITNFVVFPILQAIAHRALFFGLVINAVIAVLGVKLFNALGLTDYLLFYIPVLAIFSWYTYGAIRDGEYHQKKKMKITSALSSITFITVFFVYSVYLYNL